MIDEVDPAYAHIQPQDRPILGAHGKPSRAARRVANQLAKAKVEVEGLVNASVPPGFREGGENLIAPRNSSSEGYHTGELRRTEMQAGRAGVIGKGVLPAGRPSEYTEEEADVLCAWVQGGGSLNAYCKSTGRAVATVYRWMRESAGFHARYSQAHEDRADTLTDEMIEIADHAAAEASIEGVAAAKLRVETRKWIASKLRPQRWGDKQVVQHVGEVSIRIGIPAKPPATTLEMVEDIKHLPRSPQ